MKKTIRIALGSTVLATGLAFAGASPANAQVRFEGSFPLPHGRISIGGGNVGLSVGAYVPDGYSVYQDPEYGYGFYYGDQWIPCEQYGSRWVIVERPAYFGHREYRDYRYVRPYRNNRYGYSQQYRRGYDNRSYRREDHQSREHNRRWSR